MLNAQPPEVREVLLSTSILDQVSADAAVELTGDDQAGMIFAGLARANSFIQPAGPGWYRYHTLFAEVLRLKLRCEHPDRVPVLHRRAASWHGRNGRLTDAVRHAAAAGDWQLAAATVIDDLAIGQLLAPRGGSSLVGQFAGMPSGEAWAEPEPYLILAAMALSAGHDQSCAAALDAADGLLEHRPAGQEAKCRLAAAMTRLAACLRTGDLDTALAAADRAQMLLSKVPPGNLARHPEVAARVLSGRGTIELWSGRLDEAARILHAGTAIAGPGGQHERADCTARLALVEALRGRLGRARAAGPRCGPGRPGRCRLCGPAAVGGRAS